jgi:hypothetical protein
MLFMGDNVQTIRININPRSFRPKWSFVKSAPGLVVFALQLGAAVEVDVVLPAVPKNEERRVVIASAF